MALREGDPGWSAPVITIQPSAGWVPLKLRDLWEYRELLYFLVWRDVKVRYKQTVLGAAWAIIQPLFTMVVFAVFFGHLAKMPSDGIPYPLFAYAALVPWTFFAHGHEPGLQQPRRQRQSDHESLLPAPGGAAGLGPLGIVDFLLAFAVLLVLIPWYGIGLSPRLLCSRSSSYWR